jgi:hypothetical protein
VGCLSGSAVSLSSNLSGVPTHRKEDERDGAETVAVHQDVQNLYNEAVMLRQANKEHRLAKANNALPVVGGSSWS